MGQRECETQDLDNVSGEHVWYAQAAVTRPLTGWRFESSRTHEANGKQ